MQAQFVTPTQGLTGAQVKERIDEGRTNAVTSRTSRSVSEIVRGNVFTTFNALLSVLWVVVMATGRWQNGLFGFVIVANSSIGIFEELRAKRTLDRLAVLNVQNSRVMRDGELHEITIAELVCDDLVELRAGDQVPADGVVTESAGLEIDESLLTGESDPIAKDVDSDVRSGSIVVAGKGWFQATRVGPESYANKLALEAKQESRVKSELVAGTNQLLRWISLIMLLVAPVLLWSQFRAKDNEGWQDAVTGVVAGLVGMVPEGLVLLTSLAFMVGTVTLARKQTLVQELAAVEGLARVDVVCLDKTGTLTHGDIAFDRVELLNEALEDDVHEALAACAGADSNATALALSAQFTECGWTRVGAIPFSSARKWSAVITDVHGSWVLGAPEMVISDPSGLLQVEARTAATKLALSGQRVLLLARTEVAISADGLPADLAPHALVVLTERVREDAPETLRFFDEQGVTLKVISGDNPHTVGAIAAKVGIPGIASASDAVDARTLPTDPDELAEVVERNTVFGRVSPQQKRAMVGALQSRGHVVAMTGDGVNDALALKDADIGIAMGNGSPATRAVAQLVLLDSKFSHLPDVVAEGRRVIANIERSANLFLVKNVYSLVLVLICAVTLSAYPLAPIQLTLISTLTIGIPGFMLALAHNKRRYIPGFLPRILRFAVPTGLTIGISAFAGYQITRALDDPATVAGGRTTATLVVLIIALWTLMITARPLTGWKLGMVATMAGAAALVVTLPILATDIFLLEITVQRVVIAAVLGASGAAVVEIAHRVLSRRR